MFPRGVRRCRLPSPKRPGSDAARQRAHTRDFQDFIESALHQWGVPVDHLKTADAQHYVQLLIKPLYDLLRLRCANRARQRRKLCHFFADWRALQDHADYLDEVLAQAARTANPADLALRENSRCFGLWNLEQSLQVSASLGARLGRHAPPPARPCVLEEPSRWSRHQSPSAGVRRWRACCLRRRCGADRDRLGIPRLRDGVVRQLRGRGCLLASRSAQRRECTGRGVARVHPALRRQPSVAPAYTR